MADGWLYLDQFFVINKRSLAFFVSGCSSFGVFLHCGVVADAAAGRNLFVLMRLLSQACNFAGWLRGAGEVVELRTAWSRGCSAVRS